MALMTAAEYFGESLPPSPALEARMSRSIRSVILPSGCRLYQLPAIARHGPSTDHDSDGIPLGRTGEAQPGAELSGHSE